MKNELLAWNSTLERSGALLLAVLLNTVLVSAAEQRWSREHDSAVTHPASPMAVTTHGDELLVGGGFSQFNGSPARLVARSATDGVWSDGSIDYSGWITSFATAGGELIAGGNFESLDRSPAVVRWDQDSWQPLGDLANAPNTLLLANDTLYAGGGFFSAGGSFLNGVVVWDGQSWSQVGPGVAGSVYSLARFEGKLVAGGIFSQAGGQPASGLASWDGSSWSELGGGLAREFYGGEARALVAEGNSLYVGGAFVSAGGLPANAVARWDGSNWAALGGGLTRGSLAATVQSMVRLGSDLFVGGDFTSASGVSASNIARWDGAQWHALGGGLDGPVAGLTVQGTRIIAVGRFRNSGSIPLPGVAAWDGTSWHPLASKEPESPVTITSVERFVGAVFAAGHFLDGDRVARSFLGRWNGVAWERFDQAGSALSFTASCIHDDNLYFTTGRSTADPGSFTPGNELLRWNGSYFDRITNSLGNTILAMAGSSAGVYCGGTFGALNGWPSPGLALLVGTAMQPVGNGMPPGGIVSSLASDGGDLYVGGQFTLPGVPSSNVAKWDGTNWLPLGEGFDRVVNSLQVVNGVLYAGGGFTQSGATSMHRVARWDGSAWHALGDGLSGNVWALAGHVDGLYAAGSFSEAGPFVAPGVAFWDGERWHGLGGGLNAPGRAARVSGGRLLLGGSFDTAGGVLSEQLATWFVPQRISIQARPGEVRIAWPVDAEGYQLQQSTTLQPGSWTDVLDLPGLNGAEIEVFEPVGGVPTSYRLVKP